jgi:acetate kinase
VSGNVLAVNVGSSSLKLSLVDESDRAVASLTLDMSSSAEMIPAEDILAHVETLGPFETSSHRVVHGGDRFSEPVLVDEAVLGDLEELVHLAPLHQRRALAALGALFRGMPDRPAVACFDTAFHSTIPPSASTYAIPRRWRECGIRRYGFHGLSFAYATRRASELMGRPAGSLRMVIAHLGSGASLAAVEFGRAVDTTMGFTPMEGLVMATRSGNVDPGALLWLMRTGVSPEDLERELEHASGLQGLAGSPDMRVVLKAASHGDPEAMLAIDVYVHRLRGLVAGMVGSMGGMDVLVMTGGVGENSSYIRSALAEGLEFLGVEIDHSANAAAMGTDAVVSPESARVPVVVVVAREDLELARGARQVLAERATLDLPPTL